MNEQRETVGSLLREQTRLLARIRMCAEIWALIGVLLLFGFCAGSCLALLGLTGTAGL